MKRALLLAGGALTLLGAAALAGVGMPEEAHGDAGITRTVTVTGYGTVKAKPDRALLSFGVDSRADTARAASAQNAAAMQRLIDALEGAGVPKDKLRTEHVSVWPVTTEPGTINGYTASASVSADVAVDKAGELIDVATGNGANTVSGPSLTLADTDSLEEQALARALDDARRKAKALAAAADANLGEVVKLVEGAAAQPMPYAERTALDLAKASATPIEPGLIETQGTLTVTFALK
jgi:uncharacterized protein YggE